MKYRWLATLFFCSLPLLLLIGCSKSQESSAGKPRRPPPQHLVEVYTVERQAVSSAHQRTGTLRARRTVRIHSQEEGKVTQAPFYEGDRVKRGQRIVTLADELLRAELKKLQATAKQASVDLQRLNKLAKKRAVSDDELIRARTALDVADAGRKLLETRLGYTRITAPFDAVITERMVEPGDVVARHAHLLTLSDPNSLVTELSVSELLLPQIATGDTVEVTIDALGSRRFPGRILRIHPDLDPVTHQGTVEVVLEPVPDNARSGQFARITLKTVATDRMLVPFASVQHDRDGEFVYLLNGEQEAIRQGVRSGIRIADKIEILEGLNPGDQVIQRGFLGLNVGKKVKVVNKAAG